VKASNSSGIWNEKGIAMRVILLPPWWQTWWAYILYSAVFLSVMFFVRQFELKRVQLRNELQLKNVEARKLQEIDKMKSRFFANISHEFRTPLTLVLGLVDKLTSEAGSSSKKDFGIIRKNAYRLLQLINQLLELSRLEAGTVELKVSKYDINLFLRRVLSSFASLAESRNLHLRFNDSSFNNLPEQEEVFLYFDPEKFETIFYNLIGNAIKFSPEDERIEIEVIPHIHNVEIRITNTGTGIKEDNLPFIFNRFYQADETSSRGYEGTGIGLALAKELIELHNGEINVMSIEDKEVTFTIRMPVGRAHYNPKFVIDDTPLLNDNRVKNAETYELIPEETDNGTEKTIAENSGSRIILVVEDNVDLRNYLVEQLEDAYTVVEAENGEKGLQIADEIIPDLIISDIMMPVMDGYELCKRVRKNFKTSHIPIIMLTAKAGRDDKIEGLETGADDYLLKPFDRKELLVRVKNLISIRDRMKEKCRTEMLFRPKEITVPSTEKVFIEKLTGIIDQNMSSEKFGVDELSSRMGLSRSQLHRKLKAITDQSTTEFIRNFRLQRAADLIRQDSGNMAEIAYTVGFSSQAYFTKSFTDFYGISPGEFRRKNMQDNADLESAES
jgi:signal transduction histidine kinase/DNA-binding response OmpR family regulator